MYSGFHRAFAARCRTGECLAARSGEEDLVSTRIRDNQNVTRWLVIFACVLATIAIEAGVAAEAQAVPQSTVTLEGPNGGPKTLHYEAVQSRTNEVTVRLNRHDPTPATPEDEGGAEDDTFDVKDTNVNNSASSPGCTWDAVDTWACSATNVTKIVVNLGGGTDTGDLCGAAVWGGFCPFVIGVDAVIDGGSGRDRADGFRDQH